MVEKVLKSPKSTREVWDSNPYPQKKPFRTLKFPFSALIFTGMAAHGVLGYLIKNALYNMIV